MNKSSGAEYDSRGDARVPLTIKVEVSDETASGQPARMINDPVTAGCIDPVAQKAVRDGTGRIPFVIKATPAP